MDAPRIGLRAIPTDGNIAKFLEELIKDHCKQSGEIVQQLNDTIRETENEGQPVEFAFGKMLNFLATLNQTQLVEILSGALWELAD